MANHKWVDTTVLTNISKREECRQCGVTRNWWFGNYQCWRYTWLEPFTSQNGSPGHSIIESFKRPPCPPVSNTTVEAKPAAHGIH